MIKNIVKITLNIISGSLLFATGYFAAKNKYKKDIKPAGILVCNTTLNKEERYIHLELSSPLEDILKCDKIVLNVDEHKINV